jgi:hypothetical protein
MDWTEEREYREDDTEQDNPPTVLRRQRSSSVSDWPLIIQIILYA